MSTTQRLGSILVRVVVAAMLVIHGIARIRLQLVDELGVFLGGYSFVPAPHVTAWVITGMEIAGGAALAVGFFVVMLCGWFALQLAVGIALVHAQAGWFVVGAGQNGMEYSVVLMTCLAAVALLHRSRPAAARVPAREAMSRMGMALRVLATGKPAPDPGQPGESR
jgi:putative oxidoreductase